jgi:hypothetical protein
MTKAISRCGELDGEVRVGFVPVVAKSYAFAVRSVWILGHDEQPGVQLVTDRAP